MDHDGEALNEDAERPLEVVETGVDLAIEAMWRLYGEFNEWSRSADVKASIVMAANGGVLVAATAIAVGGGFTSIILRHGLVSLFCLAMAFGVIASSVYAALCLVPPLREGDKSSVLRFDYIACEFPSARDYEVAIRQSLINPDAELTLISHQVWSYARILHRKLDYVTWGIRFFIAALLFGLIALLLAYV
jgi:hypothetical protein